LASNRSIVGLLCATAALIIVVLFTYVPRVLFYPRGNLPQRPAIGSSDLTTAATKSKTIPEKGQTVQLCQLIATPDAYNDKVVTVEAVAVATLELSFLYDPTCNRRGDWIDLQFNSTATLQKVSPFSDFSRGRNAPRQAKTVLRGRFTASPSARHGHLETFRFHFLAFDVEKAEAVPETFPQPWSTDERRLLSVQTPSARPTPQSLASRKQ
jgi:hypothetical protein